MRARPPFASANARRACPSRSAIIPAGSGSCTGIGFASPGRLSISTIPAASPRRARAAFETKLQRPRETSAILPASEPFGRLPRPLFGSAAGPQRYGSAGLPSVPTIVRDVDDRLIGVRPGGRHARRSGSGRRRAKAARRRRSGPARRRASSRRLRPRSRPVRCPVTPSSRGRSRRGRCRMRSPARHRRAPCCARPRSSRRSPGRSPGRRPRS